jgi:hypothetical protein
LPAPHIRRMSLQKCEADLDAVHEESLSPLTILERPHLRVESSYPHHLSEAVTCDPDLQK